MKRWLLNIYLFAMVIQVTVASLWGMDQLETNKLKRLKRKLFFLIATYEELKYLSQKKFVNLRHLLWIQEHMHRNLLGLH